MPDAGKIREQVEARVAELEAILAPLRAEHEQLKSVAAAFGHTDRRSGASTRRSPPSRPRSAATTAGAGAGAGGGRAQQAMKLIAERPGITAAELAQAIGISRNYLYRVLPKLEQRGEVTKEGMGYHLPPPTGG
jgi:transposase-like protein